MFQFFEPPPDPSLYSETGNFEGSWSGLIRPACALVSYAYISLHVEDPRVQPILI